MLNGLAGKNNLTRLTLTGAGAYHHYIPAVVWSSDRTGGILHGLYPHWAEISQGILQSIYEYQTMIAHLTGTEIANACMTERRRWPRRRCSARKCPIAKIIVARSVHPEYRKVLKTYSWAKLAVVVESDYAPSGQIDMNELQRELDDQVAAVIIQSPNFFGVLEDVAPAG